MLFHPSITSTLHVPHAPSPPQTWAMATPISMVQERSVLPAGYSAAFPSSANVTRGIRGRFYGTVCHIGTAHQRGGLDVAEAERARLPAQLRELLGGVVAAHRMMVSGRREVLAEGEDLHAGFAQV